MNLKRRNFLVLSVGFEPVTSCVRGSQLYHTSAERQEVTGSNPTERSEKFLRLISSRYSKLVCIISTNYDSIWEDNIITLIYQRTHLNYFSIIISPLPLPSFLMFGRSTFEKYNHRYKIMDAFELPEIFRKIKRKIPFAPKISSSGRIWNPQHLSFRYMHHYHLSFRRSRLVCRISTRYV